MDTIDLLDPERESAVTIVPSRGAIVSRFRVKGDDVLYLDEATLRDPTKNVRGGIPILFPSPGKLAGDRFARAGKSGAMKQHGFARDRAWTVREASATSAVLALESDDATRAMFPWDFAMTIAFALRGPCLRLDVRVENRDRDPLPFAFGTHPYFLVRDKSRARLPTKATRAFDNVAKVERDFGGFDFTAGEVDLHLVDHGASDATLDRGDGSRVAIRASHEQSRWVVWTLPGRDFICVEPWSAPGDALNTGQSLIEIAPGASRALWLEIELRR